MYVGGGWGWGWGGPRRICCATFLQHVVQEIMNSIVSKHTYSSVSYLMLCYMSSCLYGALRDLFLLSQFT